MKERLKYYFAPFKIICEHWMEFLLWLVFVIIAGQLGTLINIVSRCIFNNMSISQSLLSDSSSGNFYTFSLVMISSLVGTFFIRLLVPAMPEHRRIIVPFVAVSFIIMLFSAVFFSFQTNQSVGIDYKGVKPADISIDWWQLGAFLISVFIAVYAFGLERLHKHREYNEMTEYHNREKENVDNLINREPINENGDLRT